MREVTDWRELLRQVISDSKERQRIANELGVNPVTLSRWATGVSFPRPDKLRRLLSTLPDRKQELETLLEQEFPGFISSGDNIPEEVPSAFYTRFFNEYTALPENRRFSLINTILQQILDQLDPNRLGMLVTIAKCMPPGIGNKVRSLLNVAQISSTRSNDNTSSFFLGIESLGGHAVESGRLIINQDVLVTSKEILNSRNVYEESSASYPLLFAGRVAGCLILSSTQTNYFSTPRLSLVKSYANLIALTLRSDDFYSFDLIDLLQMPPYHVQKNILQDFQQYIAKRMKEGQSKFDLLTLQDAELLELKKIEAELLRRNILAEKLES